VESIEQELLFPEEPLTTESWDERVTQRALDELFKATIAYRSSQSYLELMRFIARFRFYSVFNAMLIHIQRPGARFVAPPSRWEREYDRRVKPDANPLVILQPMGPVMFVFDVSDTEGKRLPPQVENPFGVGGGPIGNELKQTIENVKRDGIRIHKSRMGSQRAGSIRTSKLSPPAYVEFPKSAKTGDKKRLPVLYELTINLDMRPEACYATLVHELAHLYCGHVGTPDKKWWPDRRSLPRNSREFEAESVTYLVCSRLGIDNPSAEYLAGYAKTEDQVPDISLDSVIKAAGLVEEMGKRRLSPRKPSGVA